VDVKGTGAGGAFTTVIDVGKLWTNLLSGRLLSENMLKQMFYPHSSDDPAYYGYGMWLDKSEDGSFVPYFQGCDPGVSYISGYDIESNLIVTIVSNFGCNVWRLRRNILKAIRDQ
jgi:hypothetical protein